MNEIDALELVRAAIWTIIIGAGPSVAAAMAVGIAVALLQALTQIQEVTLTFVPKLAAVALVLLLAGNWMLAEIVSFTENLYEMIPRLADAA